MRRPNLQERERSKALRRERISLREEKKLWKKGYKRVAGLDEAGRGPLAGPVVAAAVVVNRRRLNFNQKVNDSKKLSPKKREELFKVLTKHPDIEWGVGRVSEKVIDKINILKATKLAMAKAVEKVSEVKPPSFLILDGKMSLDLAIKQKSIIKADEKVFSCAAASIIAKVTRDRIMQKYAKEYPQYHFNQHKGYPTLLHRKILKKQGPCSIHRRTFGRVTKCH